jgi:uncharacterized protein YjdB
MKFKKIDTLIIVILFSLAFELGFIQPSYAGTIAVTGITVSTLSGSLSMIPGDTTTLQVTATDASGKKGKVSKDITWATSDSTVATISNGKVTALAAGTTDITATYGGSTATSSITVFSLTALTVTPSSASLIPGDITTLQVNATYANGKQVKISKGIIWDTSDATVATVANGKITALAAGSTDIKATYGESTATTTITVAAIDTLTITPSKANLIPGDNATLQLNATYVGGKQVKISKGITWETSDSTIATVTNGKVTALAAGSTDITATYGGSTATSTITVAALKALTITPSSASLIPGDTATLQVNATYVGGKQVKISKGITWETSDSTIATVTNGKVTALAAGSTDIKATYGESTAMTTMSVAAIDTLTITPSNANLIPGDTATLQVNATYVGGKQVKISKGITWDTSGATVATVTNGKVTALAAGSADIKATYGESTATTTMTVAAIDTLTITPSNANLIPGDTSILQVNATYVGGKKVKISKGITWEASDATIATVTNGKVTALAAGSTDITATYAGGTATIHVAVAKVSSLTLSPSNIQLTIKKSTNVVITAIYSNGESVKGPKGVVWSSSDISTATVNSDGKVTAVSTGSTIISATFNGITVNSTIVIS